MDSFFELEPALTHIPRFKSLKRLGIGVTNGSYIFDKIQMLNAKLDISAEVGKQPVPDVYFEGKAMYYCKIIDDDEPSDEEVDEKILVKINVKPYDDGEKKDALEHDENMGRDDSNAVTEDERIPSNYLETSSLLASTKKLSSVRLFGRFEENLKKAVSDLAAANSFPLVFAEWYDFRERPSWFVDYQGCCRSIVEN